MFEPPRLPMQGANTPEALLAKYQATWQSVRFHTSRPKVGDDLPQSMALEFDFAVRYAEEALTWHWPGQETMMPPQYMVDDGSRSRYLPIVHNLMSLLHQLESDLRRMGVTEPKVGLGSVLSNALGHVLGKAASINYFVLVYHLPFEVEYSSNRAQRFNLETMVPHPASVWVIDRDRASLYNYYYGRWRFPNADVLQRFLRDFYGQFRAHPQVQATLFPLDSQATLPERLVNEAGLGRYLRYFSREDAKYVLGKDAPNLWKIWEQHGFERFEEVGASVTCKVFSNAFLRESEDHHLAEALFAAFREGRKSVNGILNPAGYQARLHEFFDPANYNWVPREEECLESESHSGCVVQLVPKDNPAQSYFIIGGYRFVADHSYWLFDHRIGYLRMNTAGELFAMYTAIRSALINHRYYNEPRLKANGCSVRIWSLTRI